MDFVGQGWLGYMSEIQTNCNTDTEQEVGINQYMAKLKRSLKKKSNLIWHIEFLQKYVRENINPLGLRIQLYPSFQVISPEFKIAWESILTQCSSELMKLLISHYQMELNNLDQEMLLQTSNENIRDHMLFSKRVQEIKDHITRITKDIIYQKQNKLCKDRLAFSEGFAYHTTQHKQRALEIIVVQLIHMTGPWIKIRNQTPQSDPPLPSLDKAQRTPLTPVTTREHVNETKAEGPIHPPLKNVPLIQTSI